MLVVKKRLLFLLQNVALSLLSSLMAVLLIRWLSSPIPGFSGTVIRWLVTSLAGTVVGIILTRTYSVMSCSTARMCLKFLWIVLVKEIVMSVALVSGVIALPETVYSVLGVLADSLLSLSLLCFFAYLVRQNSGEEVANIRRMASRRNVLVAGTGERSVNLHRELASSGEYNVIGFITVDESLAGRVIDDLIVYHCATTGDLCALERRLGRIDCVWMPDGGCIDAAAPNESGRSVIMEDAVRDRMSSAERRVKRAIDVLLSLILLVVFSPLFALCALAVRMEDGGPVIYRQERVGLGGRPFLILKFRSMHIDAEESGPLLSSGEQDSRLTRTGAFLRRHHLDELPQLWNVFRGDMSFIGWRPERQCYIDEILRHNRRYTYLYQIRPGVTSYATLYNGYTDTMEKMLTRLDLDLYYLRNHSLAFDMRVLGLTFLNIVFGREF